jgi:hypothetical protein
MSTLSSRPQISTTNFTTEENELIAALMCIVKLGVGFKYREAALSVMTKLEAQYSTQFISDSCLKIKPEIQILDTRGYPIMIIPTEQIEILV